MGSRLDQAVAGSLVIAALTVAVSTGYRTIRPTRSASSVASVEIPPTEWKRMTALGIPFAGNSDANVTVIELTDLECPACRGFQTDLDEVIREHGANVAFLYVPFPLTTLHRFAMAAAKGAECAADRGKLYDWVTTTYKYQDSLGIKSWAAIAAAAGIQDSTALASCVMDPNSAARVDSSLALGDRLGIASTPTIIVNGVRFRGTPTRAALDSAIRAALQKPAAGTE